MQKNPGCKAGILFCQTDFQRTLSMLSVGYPPTLIVWAEQQVPAEKRALCR